MSKSRNEIVQNPIESSLLDLPKDLLLPTKNNKTGSSFASMTSKSEGTQIMGKLSNTSKTLHTLFQPELDKRAAKQLLQYVLESKKDEALKIIKANPKLLFVQTTAHDYAKDLDGHKRTIKNWSPLQAMFGTGDMNMLKAVFDQECNEKMAYIDRIPDGRKLASAQVDEKFPNGFDYPASTYSFNELASAITADQMLIKTGQPNEVTEEKLAQFRKYFQPGIVNEGHHFNLKDVLKACQVHDENWSGWERNQLLLYWTHVIGYLQRFIVAIDVEALFCNEHDDLQRSQLKQSTEKKMISYFPLDMSPENRLGIDFGVDLYLNRGWLRGNTSQMQKLDSLIQCLNEYIEQKQGAWKLLIKNLKDCSPQQTY